MNRILSSLLLLILFISCTEEYRQYDLKGNIQFHVNTLSETGMTIISDKEWVQIRIEGTNPELTLYTDTAGNLLIEDLPLGTYHIIFSKDGYYPLKIWNYKFMGSDEPVNLEVGIRKECSIIVKEYNVSIENNRLYVSGTISHHDNPLPPSGLFRYSLQLYLGSDTNVSPANAKWMTYFYTLPENDTIFDHNTSLSSTFSIYFPSNSTVYTVIIGNSGSIMQDYNYETDSYETYGFGVPSQIKSFIVP